MRFEIVVLLSTVTLLWATPGRPQAKEDPRGVGSQTALSVVLRAIKAHGGEEVLRKKWSAYRCRTSVTAFGWKVEDSTYHFDLARGFVNSGGNYRPNMVLHDGRFYECWYDGCTIKHQLRGNEEVSWSVERAVHLLPLLSPPFQLSMSNVAGQDNCVSVRNSELPAMDATLCFAKSDGRISTWSSKDGSGWGTVTSRYRVIETSKFGDTIFPSSVQKSVGGKVTLEWSLSKCRSLRDYEESTAPTLLTTGYSRRIERPEHFAATSSGLGIPGAFAALHDLRTVLSQNGVLVMGPPRVSFHTARVVAAMILWKPFEVTIDVFVPVPSVAAEKLEGKVEVVHVPDAVHYCTFLSIDPGWTLDSGSMEKFEKGLAGLLDEWSLFPVGDIVLQFYNGANPARSSGYASDVCYEFPSADEIVKKRPDAAP